MHRRLLDIYKIAVETANPYKLIKTGVSVDYSNSSIDVFGNKIDINTNFQVIGFGKAVCGMAIALQDILGDKIKSGVISVPENSTGVTNLKAPIIAMMGGKDNLPDEHSVAATNAIITLIKNLVFEDLLLVLISGGGSSLLCKPTQDLSLGDKLQTIQLLTQYGADIKELNAVRKKLSSVKGGGLAKLCPNQRTICLILSDVIGDPIDVIASGPMVQTSNKKHAIEIINKYELNNKIPEKALMLIKAQEHVRNEETSKIINVLVGSNQKSLQAIKDTLETNSSRIVIGSSSVQGRVTEIANFYAFLTEETLKFISNGNKLVYETKLKSIFNHTQDFTIRDGFILEVIQACSKEDIKQVCTIFGGETTVIIKGNGKGGRNQELSVRVSELLFNLKQTNPELFLTWDVMFLSAGTDGIDGPTDAAGGIGCSQLIEEGLKEGMDVCSYLDNNDSYTYLSAVRDGRYLLKPGSTGTNVMDLHSILFYKK